MKLEPPAPLEDPTSKPKNRGMGAMVLFLIILALLVTLVLWVILWSGGASKAQDEPVKPMTAVLMTEGVAWPC